MKKVFLNLFLLCGMFILSSCGGGGSSGGTSTGGFGGAPGDVPGESQHMASLIGELGEIQKQVPVSQGSEVLTYPHTRAVVVSKTSDPSRVISLQMILPGQEKVSVDMKNPEFKKNATDFLDCAQVLADRVVVRSSATSDNREVALCLAISQNSQFQKIPIKDVSASSSVTGHTVLVTDPGLTQSTFIKNVISKISPQVSGTVKFKFLPIAIQSSERITLKSKAQVLLTLANPPAPDMKLFSVSVPALFQEDETQLVRLQGELRTAVETLSEAMDSGASLDILKQQKATVVQLRSQVEALHAQLYGGTYWDGTQWIYIPSKAHNLALQELEKQEASGAWDVTSVAQNPELHYLIFSYASDYFKVELPGEDPNTMAEIAKKRRAHHVRTYTIYDGATPSLPLARINSYEEEFNEGHVLEFQRYIPRMKLFLEQMGFDMTRIHFPLHIAIRKDIEEVDGEEVGGVAYQDGSIALQFYKEKRRGQLTTNMTHTLMHELFHLVQFSYGLRSPDVLQRYYNFLESSAEFLAHLAFYESKHQELWDVENSLPMNTFAAPLFDYDKCDNRVQVQLEIEYGDQKPNRRVEFSTVCKQLKFRRISEFFKKNLDELSPPPRLALQRLSGRAERYNIYRRMLAWALTVNKDILLDIFNELDEATKDREDEQGIFRKALIPDIRALVQSQIAFILIQKFAGVSNSVDEMERRMSDGETAFSSDLNPILQFYFNMILSRNKNGNCPFTQDLTQATCHGEGILKDDFSSIFTTQPALDPHFDEDFKEFYKTVAPTLMITSRSTTPGVDENQIGHVGFNQIYDFGNNVTPDHPFTARLIRIGFDSSVSSSDVELDLKMTKIKGRFSNLFYMLVSRPEWERGNFKIHGYGSLSDGVDPVNHTVNIECKNGCEAVYLLVVNGNIDYKPYDPLERSGEPFDLEIPRLFAPLTSFRKMKDAIDDLEDPARAFLENLPQMRVTVRAKPVPTPRIIATWPSDRSFSCQQILANSRAYVIFNRPYILDGEGNTKDVAYLGEISRTLDNGTIEDMEAELNVLTPDRIHVGFRDSAPGVFSLDFNPTSRGVKLSFNHAIYSSDVLPPRTVWPENVPLLNKKVADKIFTLSESPYEQDSGAVKPLCATPNIQIAWTSVDKKRPLTRGDLPNIAGETAIRLLPSAPNVHYQNAVVKLLDGGGNLIHQSTDTYGVGDDKRGVWYDFPSHLFSAGRSYQLTISGLYVWFVKKVGADGIIEFVRHESPFECEGGGGAWSPGAGCMKVFVDAYNHQFQTAPEGEF